MSKTHSKCRSSLYPYTSEQIDRLPVPDDKASWEVAWPEYSPNMFTAEHILGQPWADPDIRQVSSTSDVIIARNWNYAMPIFSFRSQFSETQTSSRLGTISMGRWTERVLKESTRSPVECRGEFFKLHLIWWYNIHECVKPPYDRCLVEY